MSFLFQKWHSMHVPFTFGLLKSARAMGSILEQKFCEENATLGFFVCLEYWWFLVIYKVWSGLIILLENNYNDRYNNVLFSRKKMVIAVANVYKKYFLCKKQLNTFTRNMPWRKRVT